MISTPLPLLSDRAAEYRLIRYALLVLVLSCSGFVTSVRASVPSLQCESETFVEDSSELFAGTRFRRMRKCQSRHVVAAILVANRDRQSSPSLHPFCGHRFGQNRLRNGTPAPMLC